MSKNQLGTFTARTDEIKRQIKTGRLDFDEVMDLFQNIIEKGTDPVPEPALLTSVATQIIPPLPEFDFNEWRRTTKVRIWSLGSNFEKRFVGAKCAPTQELKVQSSDLQRNSLDTPIADAFGGKTKIVLTLSQFAWLLEQQPEGEEGFLLVSGWANIVYILDDNGTLWAVGGHFLVGYGWYLSAHGFDNPNEWSAGGRVLSQFQDPLNPETSVS